MTDKQINAAIAEACGFIGWEEFQPNKNGPKFRFWDYPKDWNGPKCKPWVPKFCTDLNAMHEAENCLSLDDRNHYIDALGTIHTDSWEFATATARQRAEAFLRTLGKWEVATDKDSLTVHPATTEQSSVDHLRDATKMREEAQP